MTASHMQDTNVIPLISGGNLINEVVKNNLGNVTSVAASTDRAIGVALNTALAGERVYVKHLGIATVKAGVVAVAAGDALTGIAAGFVKTAAPGDVVIGTALQAGVFPALIEALIQSADKI